MLTSISNIVLLGDDLEEHYSEIKGGYGPGNISY